MRAQLRCCGLLALQGRHAAAVHGVDLKDSCLLLLCQTVYSTAFKVGGLHPGNEEAVTLDACRSTGVSTRSIVRLLRTDWAVRKPKWPEQPMPHDA